MASGWFFLSVCLTWVTDWLSERSESANIQHWWHQLDDDCLADRRNHQRIAESRLFLISFFFFSFSFFFWACGGGWSTICMAWHTIDRVGEQVKSVRQRKQTSDLLNGGRLVVVPVSKPPLPVQFHNGVVRPRSLTTLQLAKMHLGPIAGPTALFSVPGFLLVFCFL